MMKLFLPGLLLGCLSGSGLLAQTISGNSNDASATASPTPEGEKKKPAAQAPQGPTVIDSDNMDYDEKTRIAIFTGENYGVFVKDPSFTVYCDKLTAHMRKSTTATPSLAAPKHKPAATPAPSPRPASSPGGASARASGLQEAVAEGVPNRPVVIVQDKPPANPGDQPEHDVGIAAKADYNADTGDVFLTGWPRVSQGINTQIATSATTVMIMNKDGHTMKTKGPSRTVIQQAAAKTGTNSASPTPDAQ